jgi:hypothetical protein
VFSVRTLTSTEARLVAEAYLKAGRNPNKVGEMLGMPSFDKELLAHPLVRREVIAIVRVNSQNYSMVDHMEKLAEIRDKALDAEKFTAALGAEMAIGKAAGLYDKDRDNGDPDDPLPEPRKLTTEQIREMLEQRERQESQPALPAPDEPDLSGNELEVEDEADFFDDGLP